MYLCKVVNNKKQVIMIFSKQQKVNNVNTLTLEIEETFSNNYSVVVYDEEGDVWVEKFANTIEKAKEIGEKLLKSNINKF